MICAPCGQGKHTRCQGKDACTCQHRKDAVILPTSAEVAEQRVRLREIDLTADIPPVDC